MCSTAPSACVLALAPWRNRLCPTLGCLLCSILERCLQQAAALEPRDIVSVLTGCTELRITLEPEQLQVRLPVHCMVLGCTGRIASEAMQYSEQLRKVLIRRRAQLRVAGCKPALAGQRGMTDWLCNLQKLDSVAAFCMPAFNPRMLADYMQLRAPMGCVPTPELTQVRPA